MSGTLPVSDGMGLATAPRSSAADRWPRKDPAVHDELLGDGSMVLYHAGRQQVLTLNPTAALIWECCDGAHDLAAIAGEVREIFPTAPDPEGDVRTLLGTLRERGMLLDTTP